MTRLLYCSLLCLTAGCALSPRYVESTGADAATLRIIGQAVIPILYEDGSNCSQHRRWPEGKVTLAPDGGLDPQSTLLRLTPGKELALNLQRFVGMERTYGWLGPDQVTITSCDTMVSFVPQARRHFAIAFKAEGDQCYIGLLEAPTESSLDFRRAASTELRFREKLKTQGAGGAMCKS